MKRIFRNYLGIWAVLLLLFNVIAFVSVGAAGIGTYTASFWIGYGLITLSFVGQMLCTQKVIKEEDLRKNFYHFSLIRISYTGLITSFVVGGATMLIFPLPYWVGVIACAIVLAVTVIAVLKADTAAGLAETTEEKVKTQTAFIRLLTVDAENLLNSAKTDAAKTACKKVYEAVRYSDPMSSDALISIEGKISARMEVLAAAVAESDNETITVTAEEIVALLGDRNRKCKVLK